MADIPVVITSAGVQPTPPAQLLAQLLAGVSATNPGYTANLPGSLIEDISSTDVGALVLADSARVETLNSISPSSANDFVLAQLGQVYIGPGAAPAVPTNTSVFVVFTVVDASSNPVPGYVIDRGFTVSDGTYQYFVQDGGVTASDGISPALFCQAGVAGQWAVASNTVSQIITSVPSPYQMTCSNPEPGISSAIAETAAQWRARVMQAGQAISTGTTTTLKTLLGQVPGVQQRLVSTLPQIGGGWIVIAGGGDPYLTAGAINASGLDIATLVAAPIQISNISQANPGVVTTASNHNLTTGAQETLNGVLGMTNVNGVRYTITVTGPQSFSLGVDTTAFPAYVGGGTASPNPIVQTPNIIDPPNVYGIPFVSPPAQTVTVQITYHPTAPNFTSQSAVAQLAQPAIAAYINAIYVGTPINLLELSTIFAASIESVLDTSQIAALVITVAINGIPTLAVGELVSGDPYGYFTATNAAISVLAN